MVQPSAKTLFVTDLDEISSTDKEGVGVIRWDGQKAYRYVQNTFGSALTVGQVGFHDYSDDDEFFHKIDEAASVDLGAMGGVVVAASLTTLYFGWIQVLGYTASFAVTNQKTTATAAGATFKGIDSQAYLTLGAAMGTASLYPRHIMSVEAVGTVTTPAATSIAGIIACL